VGPSCATETPTLVQNATVTNFLIVDDQNNVTKKPVAIQYRVHSRRRHYRNNLDSSASPLVGWTLRILFQIIASFRYRTSTSYPGSSWYRACSSGLASRSWYPGTPCGNDVKLVHKAARFTNDSGKSEFIFCFEYIRRSGSASTSTASPAPPAATRDAWHGIPSFWHCCCQGLNFAALKPIVRCFKCYSERAIMTSFCRGWCCYPLCKT
jgi:hypothetical protein